MSGNEPSLVAKLAADQAAFAQASQKSLIEETSASFRWLMASLLALNGSAAAATLNGSALVASAKALPLALFFIGTLTALGIAFFGQIANVAMIGPVSQANFFWTRVAAGEDLDETEWQQIEAKINEAVRRTRLAKVMGWCSVLAFSAGCMAATCAALAK